MKLCFTDARLLNHNKIPCHKYRKKENLRIEQIGQIVCPICPEVLS